MKTASAAPFLRSFSSIASRAREIDASPISYAAKTALSTSIATMTANP